MKAKLVPSLCRKGLLVWMLVGLLGGFLAACAPQPTPTLPPATIALPAPPVPTATTRPATVTPASNPQPTVGANPGVAGNRQPTTLTILHTNDTLGETHPCG